MLFLRIDLNEMIERAVVQFSFISLQIQKCGDDEPAIEPLKSVEKKTHKQEQRILFFFRL